jgi:hypothetical protein
MLKFYLKEEAVKILLDDDLVMWDTESDGVCGGVGRVLVKVNK